MLARADLAFLLRPVCRRESGGGLGGGSAAGRACSLLLVVAARAAKAAKCGLMAWCHSRAIRNAAKAEGWTPSTDVKCSQCTAADMFT